jgi:hypothetical protein
MASFTFRLARTSGQFRFFGEQENLLSLWAVERLLDRGPVTTLTELCHEKLTIAHLSLKTGQFLNVLAMYCLTVRYR